MIVQRTNTILYCDRWAETVAFYRDILNFPIYHQMDWFVEFQLTSQAFLSIAQAERATINSVDGDGITMTFQVKELQELYSHLQKQSITVTPMKKKWGATVFYLHDPEGHRIEFWQPL